jgi:hypothetical protein
MTDISRATPEIYRHSLLEEEQAVSQAGVGPQQTAQAQNVPTDTPVRQPAVQRVRPEDARTPQEAVQAIHALALPNTADLANVPVSAQGYLYQSRVEAFNRTRLDAAQAALERFTPRGSDANSQQSLSTFNNDPYVRELRRIGTEATEQPGKVPSYLTSSERTLDARQLSFPDTRRYLGYLGVEIPEKYSPQDMQAAYQILSTVPESVAAKMINPGMQVNFSSPVVGLGFPSIFPVRGGGVVRLEGEAELSKVYTGVDFEQTQTFELTAQPYNTLYQWSERYDALPDSARKYLKGKPWLLNQLKRPPLPVAGSVESFGGERLKYEAVVTPEQGARLSAGDTSAAPNPLDPLNMPSGTSVLLRGQDLQGTAFELSRKILTSQTTNTQLEGSAFGVRRLEGSMVEVVAGPTKQVENDLFLGVGRRGWLAAGASVEDSFENQRMSTARIDLSTSEGQAAYQNFMSAGIVPNWSPPGVMQAGTSEIMNSERARRLGIDVGPWSLGVGDKSTSTVARTTWQDGRVEQRNSYVAGPDNMRDITTTLGADGKLIDSQTTWRMVMANSDPSLATGLREAFNPGQPAPAALTNPQHLQLTFNANDLMRVKDQARAYVDSIDAQTRQRHGNIETDTVATSGAIGMLSQAKTPQEVFSILSRLPSPSATIDTLLHIRAETGAALPGQLAIRNPRP